MKNSKELKSTKKVIITILVLVAILTYLSALNMVKKGLLAGGIITALLTSFFICIVIMMMNIPPKKLPLWLTVILAMVFMTCGGIFFRKSVEIEETEICEQSLQSQTDLAIPAKEFIRDEKRSSRYQSMEQLQCKNRQLFLGIISTVLLACGFYILIRSVMFVFSMKVRSAKKSSTQYDLAAIDGLSISQDSSEIIIDENKPGIVTGVESFLIDRRLHFIKDFRTSEIFPERRKVRFVISGKDKLQIDELKEYFRGEKGTPKNQPPKNRP